MSPMEAPQQDVVQTIKYNGNDTEFSAIVVGHDVTIQCASGQHTHGSSKVKLMNRIDYNWEVQYYRGQLVAVHINGKIVAYGMKGKDGGMVRVTNPETGERALIKNLKKDVKDIAFAFSKQQIVLGCIDEEGNVLIYDIKDEPTSITCTLLLHIYHTIDVERNLSDISSTSNYRIIWCPYVSCYDEEDMDTADDPEKMFVILNNNQAEIWNFGIINNKYGTGPIKPNENFDGYVEINHTHRLADASFSSDGTAIAIACSGGYVKFFQIYMVDGEKQKCLHEWRPHDGKPLSSIIFVDNLLECSSQCWKFTITGANHNSELKLWSCETWSCLQTIHFQPHPSHKLLSPDIFLKMCIDYSGQYLVLTDLNNKALYVLQLKRQEEVRYIAVTTVSQFLLPTAFLSFHITEAAFRKLSSDVISNEDYLDGDLEEQEEDEDDEDTVSAVVLKMLVIQQKKFQQCNIVFQPDSMLCNTEIKVNETKVDDEIEEKLPKLDDLQSSVTLLIQQQQQQQQQQKTLMTPEDFTDQKSRPNSVRNSLGNEVNSVEPSAPMCEENLIDFQRPEKDNFASGGSSPSREVQEILSLNNSTYSPQDYFDNLTKLQDEQDPPQKEYSDGLLYPENGNVDMPMWLKLPLGKDGEGTENRLEGTNQIAANLNETEWSKTNVQAINFRLTSIENAITDQNDAIQKLHAEIKEQKSSSRERGELKEHLVKELELAMSKQQLQLVTTLENLLSLNQDNDRGLQEHAIANISQMVSKSVGEKVQYAVVNEMKQVVIPTIRTMIGELKHQLDVQNSQKLNSDMVLQDKISKMINSKTLAESLSNSVASVMSPVLEKCYKDMVSATLVPSLEKVFANMFQQINDIFAQGTKEYTQSVEGYMERQKRVQEKSKDIVVQLQSMSDMMNANSEKLTLTLTTEIHKQFTSAMKHNQDTLIQNVKDVVTEQLTAGFKSHASTLGDTVLNAVRSRAVTPSSHMESQVSMAQIEHLIAKENYGEAFQLALSAENLNFVIHVCEKVDSNTLFDGPSPPAQNCILALIQQLSMDLTRNTDLKLSYIRSSLVALQPDLVSTKQFIPKVLRSLLKQLQLFMSTNPSSKLMTEAKLLRMAVESILDK